MVRGEELVGGKERELGGLFRGGKREGGASGNRDGSRWVGKLEEGAMRGERLDRAKMSVLGGG